MPPFPNRVSFAAWFNSSRHYAFKHLNFYRTHLLFFTFTPLIFSGILYAANGEYHVAYIDCLFCCVSAMTVCGLTTVDLSGMTTLQQVLLLIQLCLGSPVVVSWTIVYIRRSFFARKFKRIVEAELARRASEKAQASIDVKIEPQWKRMWKLLRDSWKSPLPSFAEVAAEEDAPVKHRGRVQLRPDMIRRVEVDPQRVDPSGWISERVPATRNSHGPPIQNEKSRDGEREAHPEFTEVEQQHGGMAPERDSREPQPTETSPRSTTSPVINATPILRTHTINRPQGRGPQLARTQTVEFAATPQQIPAERRFSPIPQLPGEDEPEAYATSHHRRSMSRPTMSRRTMSRPTMSRPTMSRPTISRPSVSRHNAPRGASVPRTGTITTAASQPFNPQTRTMHRGFGGFPMPHELLSRLFGRAFPQLERKLTRTITIPHTHTIASGRGTVPPGSRPVPYISFEAVVGRNSAFQELTLEQLEELGGVEYRALTALLWIVGSYHIGLQVIAFTIIAPYMSLPRWASDFVPPALHRPISSVWFSVFQVASSYTNTGMSLVDQSVVPFQQAYPLIIVTVILVLAGNTGFPIFLRFMIWVMAKLIPGPSRLNETLHFLLDHPRRCFIYLFPSHQTWLLFIILFALNLTDWFFFVVLDLGNPAIRDISIGTRCIIGLLQATAVRSAGFATVTLSALAPAVKVLFVLMMYVSIYPIAMSVRSTNVYEDQSLGIFRDDEEETSEEAVSLAGSRAWGRYLAKHARQQLSFDMWWLGLALFLVCIIEKDGIDETSSNSWFTIFTIIFELVSAYGTVGLSLGVPNANYSFSGGLRPLSKLIICAVMLRGRHRALPVAIDRAVMLPYEFKEQDGAGIPRDDALNNNGVSHTSTTSDSASERSHQSSYSSRESSAPTTIETAEEKSDSASRRRGRDITPRNTVVHAETLRRMEETTNDIVDDQLRDHRGILS